MPRKPTVPTITTVRLSCCVGAGVVVSPEGVTGAVVGCGFGCGFGDTFAAAARSLGVAAVVTAWALDVTDAVSAVGGNQPCFCSMFSSACAACPAPNAVAMPLPVAWTYGNAALPTSPTSPQEIPSAGSAPMTSSPCIRFSVEHVAVFVEPDHFAVTTDGTFVPELLLAQQDVGGGADHCIDLRGFG